MASKLLQPQHWQFLLVAAIAIQGWLPGIGQVAIGNSTPVPSALLELKSSNQGFLPPRMTTQQRNAIPSPAQGLIIFNTEEQSLNFYNGDFWESTRSGIEFDPCANGLPFMLGGSATMLPTGLAVDASGNCVIVGSFTGTLSLGGNNISSQGGFDLFIAKISGSGEVLWYSAAGLAGFENIRNVQLLQNGDLVICGTQSGTLNFLNTTFTDQNGGIEFFVARISANGEVRWKKTFDLQGSGEILSMAIGDRDQIYIGGRFSGSINPGGNNLLTNSKLELFLASLDSAGSWRFVRTTTQATVASNAITRIAVRGNKVYLTGSYGGNMTLGNINLSTSSSSAWIARADSLGNFLWAFDAENQNQSFSGPVAVHPGGDLVTGVTYQGANLNFGDISLPNATGSDFLLARIDSTGTIKWVNRYGGAGNETVSDLAFD
ncbi:MAG: hypothetical protein MUF24_09580, partial [Chitinophagaceae bacterium]|nr:hypothetical protein [Chitinophagaceae bacterium]